MKWKLLLLGAMVLVFASSVYADTQSDLWDSAIGIYHLNNDTTDSRNNYDGDSTTALELGTGDCKLGTCYNFTRNTINSGDNITIPYSLGITNYPMAVSLWAYEISGTSDYMLSWGDKDVANQFFSINYDGNKQEFEIIRYSGGLAEESISGKVKEDSWYHIVCNFLNTTYRTCYINGTLNATLTAGDLFPTGVDNFKIGISPDSSPVAPLNGRVDEVIIFNRTINQTEIDYLYNSGEGRELTNPSAISANIDLIFYNKSWTPDKLTFGAGEDYRVLINWTASDTNETLNDSVGSCNITIEEAFTEVDATDGNFTLCGTGCDYTDIYVEEVNTLLTNNAANDTVYAEICHEQLAQGDVTFYINCSAGSYTETLAAGNFPLCSSGNYVYGRVTSDICVGEQSVNITIEYDGINGRRKQVVDFALDRLYMPHTINDTEIVFNSSLQLWHTTDMHEWYEPDNIQINATCDHTLDDNYDATTSETITIENALPEIFFNQVNTSIQTKSLVDNMTIINATSKFTWTGTVYDINLANFTVSWYNSTGHQLLNMSSNTSNITSMDTPVGLFYDGANPYSMNVTATDTEGLINNASIRFNITPLIDITKPFVTLHYPANGANLANVNETFNCSAVDNSTLDNISFFHDISGSMVINSTTISPGNNTRISYNISVAQGTYTWTCQACDSYDNCNFASVNYTFTETYPSLNLTIHSRYEDWVILNIG